MNISSPSPVSDAEAVCESEKLASQGAFNLCGNGSCPHVKKVVLGNGDIGIEFTDSHFPGERLHMSLASARALSENLGGFLQNLE